MSPKNSLSDLNPSDIYPDPIGKTKEATIASRLADIALAGDTPASRLFSNLSAVMDRDIWQEVRREREEMSYRSRIE